MPQAPRTNKKAANIAWSLIGMPSNLREQKPKKTAGILDSFVQKPK